VAEVGQDQAALRTGIAREDPSREYWTPEGCFILAAPLESLDETLTIARARVEPGVRTKLHALDGVVERYLITEGRGEVEVGDLRQHVGPGDVVIIPAGVPQRITNTGPSDLLFYCICTPPFTPSCYRSLE
jgi:mannose-6-phosphate isomerase-like protein (cupin superfamily)